MLIFFGWCSCIIQYLKLDCRFFLDLYNARSCICLRWTWYMETGHDLKYWLISERFGYFTRYVLWSSWSEFLPDLSPNHLPFFFFFFFPNFRAKQMNWLIHCRLVKVFTKGMANCLGQNYIPCCVLLNVSLGYGVVEAYAVMQTV